MVTGTGFTGTPETTELNVAGRKQTSVSVNSTHAIFRVSDISGWTLSGINVYFDVGLPRGYDTVIQGKTLTLEPRLISVTPNVGSVGGSVIRARVEGLGPLTNKTEAYWLAYGGTIVDNSSGASICAKAHVVSYGIMECHTIKGNINSGTVVAAKSYASNTVQVC